MKIILNKDVDNLGFEFDVVEVKPGYGRNFLIPQKLGSLATPKAILALEETLKQKSTEEAASVASATDVANKIKAIDTKIPAKVGEGDKLFGSINNLDLVQSLAKSGISIDKKHIKIPGNTIKRLGKYTTKVRLHRQVEFDYEFEIISQVEV